MCVFILLGGILEACDTKKDEPTPPDPFKTEVSEVVMTKGSTQTVTITGGAIPIRAKSADEKVAMVSIETPPMYSSVNFSELTIKGLNQGNTTVTVTDSYGSTPLVIIVKVKDQPNP